MPLIGLRFCRISKRAYPYGALRKSPFLLPSPVLTLLATQRCVKGFLVSREKGAFHNGGRFGDQDTHAVAKLSLTTQSLRDINAAYNPELLRLSIILSSVRQKSISGILQVFFIAIWLLIKSSKNFETR